MDRWSPWIEGFAWYPVWVKGHGRVWWKTIQYRSRVFCDREDGTEWYVYEYRNIGYVVPPR